jgi:hypothetical protein
VATEKASPVGAPSAGTPARRSPPPDTVPEAIDVIRHYGMPTIAFATGIYAFIVLLGDPTASDFKVGAAVVLIVVGLSALLGPDLWQYSRDNPPVRDDKGKP